MSYTGLAISRFPDGTCIPQALPPMHAKVNLDSPALQCMTDLAQVKAATIAPDTSLAQAEQNMIHQGVRLLFVVSDMPCVDGIVTAYDLHGDKPLRLITQRQVKHHELSVNDVMTSLSDLDTVEMTDLRKASVGDVMTTFAKTGHLHILVLEGATAAAPARIRGLISKTQIQRQLGVQVEGTEIATSFTEVSRALS